MGDQPRFAILGSLVGELHDGVDNVTVVLLERLDGLFAGAVGLVHDELNVLGNNEKKRKKKFGCKGLGQN